MRRVTVHKKRNLEDEELLIVTVFEHGVRKEDLKKWNLFSKSHEVLVRNGQNYEYKEKRA
jgi:hypothetical protein